MMLCVGCEWKLKPNSPDDESVQVAIERFDRVEGLYLSTGDYSALQQMNINYPVQTRMLIEDVLHIGRVNEVEINRRLLHFYQDSTLQKLLGDVATQYGNVDDLNEELSEAFTRLKEELPMLEVPQVYAQIGSFDQSIIVGNKTLGISLDKYLGSDYPFYLQHYTDKQRNMMKRDMIVPDCLSFYLLSLFPVSQDSAFSQSQRDQHMGRIQWVVNKVTKRQVFSNPAVQDAERMMHRNKHLTVQQLLSL